MPRKLGSSHGDSSPASWCALSDTDRNASSQPWAGWWRSRASCNQETTCNVRGPGWIRSCDGSLRFRGWRGLSLVPIRFAFQLASLPIIFCQSVPGLACPPTCYMFNPELTTAMPYRYRTGGLQQTMPVNICALNPPRAIPCANGRL